MRTAIEATMIQLDRATRIKVTDRLERIEKLSGWQEARRATVALYTADGVELVKIELSRIEWQIALEALHKQALEDLARHGISVVS